MAHTSGPFEVVKKDPGFGTVFSYEIWANHYPVKDANLIGTVTGQGYLPDDTVSANAMLFASAPDLLTALEELTDLVQGIIDGDYVPDSFTLQPARAALEKAKAQ